CIQGASLRAVTSGMGASQKEGTSFLSAQRRQLDRLGETTQALKAGGQEDGPLITGWQERLDEGKNLHIVEDEQPSPLPIEPSEDGCHHLLVIVCSVLWQGKRSSDPAKAEHQRRLGLSLHPQDCLIRTSMLV